MKTINIYLLVFGNVFCFPRIIDIIIIMILDCPIMKIKQWKHCFLA